MAPQVLDVAVVASWFPSVADHVRGRFIADQVAALLATGGVRPAVISFDPAGLVGSDALRSRLAAAVAADATRALTDSGTIFAAPGWGGPPGVPVARLPIPEGRTAAAPVLHAARHRAAVLETLGRRWLEAPAAPSGTLPPHPVLVHAHTGYPDGAAAAALAARLGVPLIITEHASFLAHLLARPEIRAAYVAGVRQAARLIVVSETLAGEIRAAMPEIADRVVVVPNAVAVDDFGQARPDVERRPQELLYVGHRTAGKGIETLLRAMARLHGSRPGISLRLIGQAPDPALDDRWVALAGRLGLGDAVTFEPPAVAAAMARAGVFVHASHRETFGVVVAEALAAGLPVAATASGGVSEIMADPAVDLGELAPPDDPGGLAAAIERVLDRRAAFDPVAMRASIVARYGSRAVADRLEAEYRAAVGAAASTRPAPRAGPAGPPPSGVPAAPGPSEPPLPCVLVALDPDRLRLAEALPDAVRASLVVVTSETSAGPGRAFGRVVTVDLGGRVRSTADAAALGAGGAAHRRLWRVLRHPRAVARRRGWWPGPERLVLTRGRAAVRAAVARARAEGHPEGPLPTLVCIDGLDHLAAAGALEREDAVMAPGGLRWLGDRGA